MIYRLRSGPQAAVRCLRDPIPMISVYKPVTDPVLTRTQSLYPRILASSHPRALPRLSSSIYLNRDPFFPSFRQPANLPTRQRSNSDPPQALPDDDARRRSYPQDHKTTRPKISSLRLLDATIASIDRSPVDSRSITSRLSTLQPARQPASQPGAIHACMEQRTRSLTIAAAAAAAASGENPQMIMHESGP